MIGLGKEVLKKIQHLLTQIDESQLHRKHKSKYDNKKINNNPIKTQNTPGKRNKKELSQSDHKFYHESTIQNKQNQMVPCSDRIEQLYNIHFKRQKIIQDKNNRILTEEMLENKPFKVENKHSLFLNDKKKRKPLYERSQQVLFNRKKSLEKIKSNLPKTKEEIADQQMQEIMKLKQSIFKKYTKQQYQEKMQNMHMRNLQRIQRQQKQKIRNFTRKRQQTKQKPSISPSSNNLWEKKKLKKNLSKNIIQRFQQYDYEKKIQWQNYLKQRERQQTPFAPQISQTSRILAERSRSKKQLFCQQISRSCSCRCLSKHQNGSFTQRQRSQQFNRSTNKKHNKSTTTVNTSQNLMSSRKLSSSKVTKRWY